jgi:C4-dicarboxylate transporter, DctM subunit
MHPIGSPAAGVGASVARRPIHGALNYLALASEALVMLALFIDLVVTFANSIARYAFNAGIGWSEDISSVTISIVAFVGAAAYFRRVGGMTYSAVVERVSGLAQHAIIACGLWIILLVCALSLWTFPAFFAAQLTQTLSVLDVSRGIVSVWLGVGLVLLAAFSVEKLLSLRGAGVLSGLAAVALLVGLMFLFYSAYDSGAIDTDPLLPIAGLMVVAFLTGTPIAIILALGGSAYFIITGEAPLVAIPAAYQAGIGSFVLLAVPFFMLAGALMDVSGMAARMIDMVQEWIGHWAGGLLIAQVVAMYIFSGMSGSKAADIATVGSVMKGPLLRRGYRPTESVAVLAAAAAMGEVVPPSLALLILGSITTLSVGALFMAGVVPAVCLSIALIITILLRSRGDGLPKGPRFNLNRALRSVPSSLPSLFMPVLVIGCIVGGIASPTEASSVATVYGLLALVFVYRSIDPRNVWATLRDAALTAGMVLFMVAASTLLSQAIVIDGLGRTLAVQFGAMHDQTTFLFVSMGVLIVIGFVLEGFPAILISAPILLPIAEQMHIDPLQYGILLVMAVGIGVFMPPVGIGFYVACAVGEAPPNATMRSSYLYNISLIIGLIVVVMFPQITLALPHLFDFK